MCLYLYLTSKVYTGFKNQCEAEMESAEKQNFELKSFIHIRYLNLNLKCK